MNSDTTLYAWARPLQIDDRLDHTWVTDYSPASIYQDIEDVIASGKHYWYCWGTFHDNNFRDIGAGDAELAVAECLVTPNDHNAHGTITRYAIDGVCHQLANQVLYSTQRKIVVSQARGYRVSHFLYGTYGRRQTAWQNQINACTSSGDQSMDDFERFLIQTLGDGATPEVVKALLEIRADFDASIEELGRQSFAANPDEGAAIINAKIASLMEQAHKILGDEGFDSVFGPEMRESVSLVDPEMFAISEAQHAESGSDKTKE